MKITNAIWFTEMGKTEPIGIIIGQDEITKEKKAYIGTGQGYDKGMDAGHIAERGSKFTEQMAKEIYNILKSE